MRFLKSPQPSEAEAAQESRDARLSPALELEISRLMEQHHESEKSRKKLSRINSFLLSQFTAVTGFWTAVVPLSMAQTGHSFQGLGSEASMALIASSYIYIVLNPAVPVDQMSYGLRVRLRGGREWRIVISDPTPEEMADIEASDQRVAESNQKAAEARRKASEEASRTRRFERDARKLRRKSERFTRRGGL